MFLKKLYYFIYYCNFQVMDSIADRYVKEAPFHVHGWTWPMFVLTINLGTINQFFNTSIFTDQYTFYFVGGYLGIAIFNFFVFTYKKRHIAIIKECSQLPFQIRRFGVVFFATYSIVSIIMLFVVIFGDLHVNM